MNNSRVISPFFIVTPLDGYFRRAEMKKKKNGAKQLLFSL